MAQFVPSKYQRAFFTFLVKGRSNCVIDAVAGSGKSTTIVHALKLIPTDKRVLFLAFNRKIVEELRRKVGDVPNVDIKTLHSLGARALMRALKSSINEDKYKTYINDGIATKAIYPYRDMMGEELGVWKANILQLIDLGRVNLVKTEYDLDDLALKHDLLLLDNEATIALRAIRWGESATGEIDFTDMIYLPCVKRIPMFQYDYVFIDECQDLNAAQRTLFLKCIKKGGRFVAVGDPRQAIYGFAGADVESFNLLKNLPHTAHMPLSVCYRCDADIIKSAKEIVPQIEAREGAPAGVIDYKAKLEDVKDGDMILCRVTKPLVALCMKYISEGVKAYVQGREIGTNLINLLKKTKKTLIPDAFARLALDLEKIAAKIKAKTHCTDEEVRENEAYRSFADKLGALQVLSEGCADVVELINRIETIFKDENGSGICLSTVHKAKGLEADRVFIACPDKFYLKSCMRVPWMAEQERNLVYVAITRAKHYLGYITDFSME